MSFFQERSATFYYYFFEFALLLTTSFTWETKPQPCIEKGEDL